MPVQHSPQAKRKDHPQGDEETSDGMEQYFQESQQRQGLTPEEEETDSSTNTVVTTENTSGLNPNPEGNENVETLQKV